MANDGLKYYMQRIATVPLLSPADESSLAARIAQGDAAARDQMICANLRLVVKIAHDYSGRGLALEDLVEEGNIGLMRAVAKFRASKGAKLSTYAAWWIKQAMGRAIGNQSRTVRIPIPTLRRMHRWRSAEAELALALGRTPTGGEVSRKCNLSERGVAGLTQAAIPAVSLNAPIYESGDRMLIEAIEDPAPQQVEQEAETQETAAQALAHLQNLDARSQAVLRLRFGLDGGVPRTLSEVSLSVGRTRERIRQIQDQALGQLRDMLARPAEEPGPLNPHYSHGTTSVTAASAGRQ